MPRSAAEGWRNRAGATHLGAANLTIDSDLRADRRGP